jgi:hypothetical protein
MSLKWPVYRVAPILIDPASVPRGASTSLRAMTSAWWTRRSIMAAATMSSPKTSPQRPNCLLEVTISEARS